MNKIPFVKTLIGSYCMSITQNIFDNPLSEVFRSPPDFNLVEDYLKIISKPIDLGTIKKKLKENQYNSFLEWKNDLLLVFTNAKIYNGEDSIIGGCASYLEKKSLKQIKKIKLLNRQNFENLLRNLYRNLHNEIEKLLGTSLNHKNFPIYELKDLEQKLTSLNDFTDILEILKKNGFENLIKKGKTTINLDILSRECLDELYFYLNK